MTTEPHAESVRVPIRVREMPERLRYLADHWEKNEHERLSRLGVMLSLRMLADEIEAESGVNSSQNEGTT